MPSRRSLTDETHTVQGSFRADPRAVGAARAVPGDGELAASMARLAERMADMTEAIQRQATDVQTRQMEDREADWQQMIRDLQDELMDAEAEHEALREEIERLREEVVNLKGAVEYSRHVIHVMERTRGWRLLVAFRRLRDAVLRRR